MSAQLATHEAQWVLEGVELGVRGDGRGRADFRHICVEHGVLPQANGSAKVHIGNTQVCDAF